jgi:hypothetical protein
MVFLGLTALGIGKEGWEREKKTTILSKTQYSMLSRRLDEIPFSNLGKLRNHRKLPLVFAANTVNYGKAYKMNTAEAISAALYITGFKADAEAIMYPFSYGEEFLRLNHDSLEAFSQCRTEREVDRLTNEYMAAIEDHNNKKQSKKEARADNIGGYMDDMDLPPQYSDDEYEYGAYDEEEESPNGENTEEI